jgi:hypothetical protein
MSNYFSPQKIAANSVSNRWKVTPSGISEAMVFAEF